jgi:hypothetical protein
MESKIRIGKFAFRALFYGIGIIIFLLIIVALNRNAEAANPVNEAVDLLNHGDGDEIFAGRQYTWQVNVSDTDGAEDLLFIKLILDNGGSNQAITFWEENRTFESNSAYFTVDSGAGDSYNFSVGPDNYWMINFTITLNWSWEVVDDTATNARVESEDEGSSTDNDNFNTDTWQCENDLIVYSMVFQCNDNWESGTGTIVDNDWIRGSTVVTASGNITYEDTINEYPPVGAAIRAQLWTDGVDATDTYQDAIDASGNFLIAAYTVPAATDSDYDFDIEIENIPTGGSHNTGKDPESGSVVDSRIDGADPSIDSAIGTETSDYIHVSGFTIYYGDDMNADHSFNVSGTASDTGGSNLNVTTFTDLTASLGAPADDNSPANWLGLYNDVDSSDSWTGTITVTLYDNVGNTDTQAFTVNRDTAGPTISSPGVTESSDFIHSSGTNIFYSNMMSSAQSFTIDGASSDGGAGVDFATFSSNLLGSPANDNSPAVWTAIYNDVDNGDSWQGTITVTVYDNVRNTNTQQYNVYRDITAPIISSPSVSETSLYIFVSGTNIYYGNNMLAMHGFNVTGSAGDGGGNVAGLQNVSFSNCPMGSPADDNSPPSWLGYFDNVDNSDTWTGTIIVRVYDNVGNSDTTTFSVFREITPPIIAAPTASSGSMYIYVSGTMIYYGDDMASAQSFTVSGTANDGAGVGVSFATFSSNALGSPANDNSPSIWGGIYNDVQNTDTWTGSITVTVYDNVSNYNTTTFTILRDIIDPGITYNSPSAGGSTGWQDSDPGNVIDIDFIWGGAGNTPLNNASYRVGSGAWQSIFTLDQSSDNTTDWGLSWGLLQEGSNQISIRVYDRVGNSLIHNYGGSTGFNFRIDTRNPQIKYNNPVGGTNTSWYGADPGAVIDIDFLYLSGSPLSYAQYQIGSGGWTYIFNTVTGSDYTTDWNISFNDLAEGENEINIRVIDQAGNLVLHTYLLDTSGFTFKKDSEAPVGVSISINGGAQYTNNASVSLSISATDATSGIYQMRISNDGVFDTELWESYSSSKLWTLSNGDGLKTVTIKFRDNALLESVVIFDTIFLDTITPSASNWTLTPGNVTEDTTGNLNITITVLDGLGGSGILDVELKYSIKGVANTNYQDMEYIGDGKWRFIINISGNSETWDDLQGLNLNYTVRIEDNAGNIGVSATQSELIDPINDPPVIAGAPTELILVIGDDYIIDLAAYISDVDNDKSSLILTTDSSYAIVDGFEITFNYPTAMSTGSVELTVSDGSASAKWIIQITVKPKIVTITKDYVTVRILLTSIASPEVNSKLTSPGDAPINKMALGEPFNISIQGGAWDWIHITVDYSKLDASEIKESTLLLYYWDSSTSTWKVCELTQPELNDHLLWANVTQTATFSAFGQPTVPPPDNDGDNLPDTVDPDDDNDNMPDIFEGNYTQLDPFINDATGDIDDDELTNLQEYQIHTNPILSDTDSDGMDDGWEHEYDLDPNDSGDAELDLDGDGYSNLKEFQEKTDPTDEESKPKGETSDDNFATIIGIIIVIIVIIILISLMMLRRRGGGEPGGRGELPPGEGDEREVGPGEGPTDEFDEVRPDLAEEYEVAELEEGEAEILKPEVTTLPTEGVIEVLELSEAIPCSVCQGEIDTGGSAIHCACGLILHPRCAGDVKECPLCGRVYDFEELGISIPEEEVVTKPLIRKEIKREIQELPPPDNAYFVYIPNKVPEKNLNNYVEGYLKSQKTGTNQPNDYLKKINIFIGIDAAKKMMEHCYKQGRVKEVMGLILGETYEHNGKTFSVAKDVATSDLDATEVNVRFENFEKLFDQLEGIKYDYQILGTLRNESFYP